MRWLSLVGFVTLLTACGSDNKAAPCTDGNCSACANCYELCVCETGNADGCTIACNGQNTGGYGNTGGSGTGAVSGGGGTGGGVLPTGGLATALTITEIAIYQAVKIPIMQNGGDVGSKNAPPVVDRAGRLRVFVNPEPEWQPREVIARFELGGSTPVTADVKAYIGGPSSDGAMDSTLNYDFADGQLKQDTTYTVTLLESSTQTFPGGTGGAKYPPNGQSPIGAESVNGVLNLTIVPIVVNGVAPNMNEQTVNAYRDRFRKLYPAPDVNLQIRQAVNYSGNVSGSGSGWNSILDYLLNLRNNDNPPNNTYYYGSFTPTQSFSQFCAGACVAGLGVQPGPNDIDGRGAVGLGVFPSGGNPGASDTCAHEIGHTMGRGHAPCNTQGDFYPYPGGSIGSWGYDIFTQNLINPATFTDIMGYCNTTWISDFNYDAIFTRLQYANSSAYVVVDDPDRTPGLYQTLVIESDGTLVLGSVRNMKRPPMMEKRTITLTDNNGNKQTVSGFWQPVDHLSGGMMLVKKELVSPTLASMDASGLGTFPLSK